MRVCVNFFLLLCAFFQTNLKFYFIFGGFSKILLARYIISPLIIFSTNLTNYLFLVIAVRHEYLIAIIENISISHVKKCPQRLQNNSW